MEKDTSNKLWDMYQAISKRVKGSGDIGELGSMLQRNTRLTKNAEKVITRPNVTMGHAIGESLKQSALKDDTDSIRQAIISKLTDIAKRNPKAADEIAKVAPRLSDLRSRYLKTIGAFPKMLKGAFIPPGVDSEAAAQSQENWVNSKLGEGS